MFEFALNRLRLNEGFALEEFESRCGLPRTHILPALQRAIHDNLLTLQDSRVQHTDRGWQFLNNLLEYFLPEEVKHA